MNYLVLLLGFVPGFVWLLFYLGEDEHPEPKREIFYTFLAGMGIVFVTVEFEYIFSDLSRALGVQTYSPVSIFGLAAIEEFFKFAAVFLVVGRSRYFDEPIDAMVYMIVAALGFATVENVFALLGELERTSLLSSVVGITTLRFVGATLLHTLSSALVGYYWARGMLHGAYGRLFMFGLFTATLLHTGFNYLVLRYEDLVVYPVVFLVVAAFFVLADFEDLKKPENNSAVL